MRGFVPIPQLELVLFLVLQKFKEKKPLNSYSLPISMAWEVFDAVLTSEPHQILACDLDLPHSTTLGLLALLFPGHVFLLGPRVNRSL